MPETPEMAHDRDPARRTVLRGVAVAAAASLPLLGTPATASAKPKPAKGKKPKGKAIAPTKAIPVGSGKYFEKDMLIITQPKKGKFVGFHATCTHANCPVSNFEEKGKMICDCHNGAFALDDGRVLMGPARKPMKLEKIVVVGGKLYKA